MNKFDQTFFKKYVPEGQELKEIIHTHPIQILLSLTIKIFLFVVIPVVFYYYSARIQTLIPSFVYLEIYLILVYIKIIYDIFDWYNDAWIVTNEGIICVIRSLFKTKSNAINYENIEGVGVEKKSVLDKILSKGDLIINKIGDDDLVLKNAIKPYKAVNLIEGLKEENETGTEDEKFDMVMDALSGVVGDYLHENKTLEKGQDEEENKSKKEVEKIKNEEGTIDLRY